MDRENSMTYKDIDFSTYTNKYKPMVFTRESAKLARKNSLGHFNPIGLVAIDEEYHKNHVEEGYVLFHGKEHYGGVLPEELRPITWAEYANEILFTARHKINVLTMGLMSLVDPVNNIGELNEEIFIEIMAGLESEYLCGTHRSFSNIVNRWANYLN